MSVTIRNAAPSDIPYLYEICLKTGDNGSDAEKILPDPLMIGQYYAAPYLFNDISLCFVAEEDARPKGYIIGTDDTTRFNDWMNETWLPPLRSRYPESMLKESGLSSLAKSLIEHIHSTGEDEPDEEAPFLGQYPAHLHIDLLPDLQGKGCGRSLLERFLAELKARKCPGVHLGVSAKNPGAVAFYRKTGFTELENFKWGFMMGMILD